jgi:hypothetical protein
MGNLLETMGIIGVIGLFILILILNPLLIMLLWNWLMPAIFGLTTISFWKACGLYILSTILFRSQPLKVQFKKNDD